MPYVYADARARAPAQERDSAFRLVLGDNPWAGVCPTSKTSAYLASLACLSPVSNYSPGGTAVEGRMVR